MRLVLEEPPVRIRTLTLTAEPRLSWCQSASRRMKVKEEPRAEVRVRERRTKRRHPPWRLSADIKAHRSKKHACLKARPMPIWGVNPIDRATLMITNRRTTLGVLAVLLTIGSCVSVSANG